MSGMSAMAFEGAPSSPEPSRVKVWVLAARPQTLWAAVSPVIVGTALAQGAGVLRWGPAAAALFGAIFIQIGTNLFNDYADFKQGADDERRIGPARATQRGWVSPRQMLWATGLTFGAATACGAYLVYVAGWPIVVIGVASILSGLAYTGLGIRLGYRGLGDVFVFVFFGLVAVGGTYFVQGGDVTLDVLAAGASLGALATAILVVNNLRDAPTDVDAGKRTLVVRFGETFGRFEYTLLVVAPYIGVAAHAMWFRQWGWLLPLLSGPLALRGIHGIWKKTGADLNSYLGITAQILLAFSALFCLGVLL